MKNNFDYPSEEKAKKMSKNGFTIGLPTEAGWYLVAARSNDEIETYFVHLVWFNPMSIDKFYVGNGSTLGKSEPYYLSENVRAFAPVPSL